MDDTKVREITNYIFKDIFGVESNCSLSELREKFAFDIPSVEKAICSLSGIDTWTFSKESEKVASPDAIAKRFKEDEWMRKKQEFNTIEDMLKAWEEINYITGEKYINSKEVRQSDGVYNSAYVFQSVSIFDSKNIIFSYKIFDSNYMFASRDNASCTIGIRVKESIFCSSSFELSWSNKVSKSIFIHDSHDLYECLFCSHLRSKKYCIANMQFEKEEYFKLKQKVVNWILSEKDKDIR